MTANELAHLAGGALPDLALRPLIAGALAGKRCALCVHRIAPVRRPTDWQQGLNMPPQELDALLELLLTSRPGNSTRWLTVGFDDGYADSAEYLRTRAARFPQVEFLFFVCPEKLERRAGFRWDLAELALRRGAPRAEAVALCDAPVDVTSENDRPDLRALAEHPDFALARVDELRSLAELPNLTLGNHTNLHLRATVLDEATVRADYRRSTECFTRLFGAPRHFAFPYGTPRHHFTPRHVELLRGLGEFLIWSTEARVYGAEERLAGAVLPRFPVDGGRTARELAGWIAARALDFKLRGRKLAGS